MTGISGARAKILSAAMLGVAAIALASCGSSGGSSPTVAPPPPPPPPTPPPSPPPPPPPGNQPPTADSFRTPEYQRTPALDQINVIPAYQRGAFGEGVTVAIIDTGIDVNNPEFAGRIDSRSADLVIAGVVDQDEVRNGGANLQDVDSHGTAVAGIVGAARNGVASHGAAPAVNLLIFRGDSNDDSLTILGGAISEGVRRSASAGAEVINFSLGSNEPDSRSSFRSIFDFTSRNDIVTVIAAGNDSNANPDGSALAAIDAQARGATIIAGAVDGANAIATFSNRAGEGAEFFLVAPGRLIQTTSLGGNGQTTRAFSGTSASTPYISAASALVRQLWPQLSAADTVRVLLESATDLGLPGTDPIYGRGLLNIGAALQPLGAVSTSTAAGVTVAVTGAALGGAPAFGASPPELGEYVFLDSVGRDFTTALNVADSDGIHLGVDPAAFIRPHETLRSAQVGGAFFRAQFRFESRDLSFFEPEASQRESNLAFNAEPRQTEARIGFAFSQALSPQLALHAAQGFSAREVDRIGAGKTPVSQLARDGFDDAFLPASRDAQSGMMAFVSGANRFDVLLARSTEEAPVGFAAFDRAALEGLSAERAGVISARVGASRSIGSAALRLESGVRIDENGLLGARFGDVLGVNASSSTVYAAVELDAPLPLDWRFGARYAAGRSTTDADGTTGFLTGLENVVSNQFAIGAYRRNAFQSDDALRLAIVGPLQISSGSLLLTAPSAYDLSTRSLAFEDRVAPLGEGSREVDFEAGYGFRGPFGARFEASLLHQTNVEVDGSSRTTALVRTQYSF